MPTLLNALQILGANTQALQRRKDSLEQQVSFSRSGLRPSRKSLTKSFLREGRHAPVSNHATEGSAGMYPRQVLELDRQLQGLQLEMWSKSPISEDDFQDMMNGAFASEQDGMEAVRALEL